MMKRIIVAILFTAFISLGSFAQLHSSLCEIIESKCDGITEEQSIEIADLIWERSKETGVRPSVILGLIDLESSWKCPRGPA